MARATLTVIGDGAWRPVGVTVDLLPHEDNVVGPGSEAAIIHGPARSVVAAMPLLTAARDRLLRAAETAWALAC